MPKSSRAKPMSAKARGRKPAKRTHAARPAKPIVLYYWPTPNGWKISVMLEECGLAYEVKSVNIGKGEQFDPAFEAVSPNNRIPAILDPHGPDGRPISVFESGAILEYLGRKTGKFYPREERRRVAMQEWLYWQMANLGPLAGQAHTSVSTRPRKFPTRSSATRRRCGAFISPWISGFRRATIWPATIRSPTSRAGPGRGAGIVRGKTSKSSRT
jgi:hypothetical protein